MCESCAQLDYSILFCTYTMTCYVCHLDVLYISDYTLVSIVSDSYDLQLAIVLICKT